MLNMNMDFTMTDKLKSWMTNPFFEVVLWSSEVVIRNNDLIKDVDVNKVDHITPYYIMHQFYQI